MQGMHNSRDTINFTPILSLTYHGVPRTVYPRKIYIGSLVFSFSRQFHLGRHCARLLLNVFLHCIRTITEKSSFLCKSSLTIPFIKLQQFDLNRYKSPALLKSHFYEWYSNMSCRAFFMIYILVILLQFNLHQYRSKKSLNCPLQSVSDENRQLCRQHPGNPPSQCNQRMVSLHFRPMRVKVF